MKNKNNKNEDKFVGIICGISAIAFPFIGVLGVLAMFAIAFLDRDSGITAMVTSMIAGTIYYLCIFLSLILAIATIVIGKKDKTCIILGIISLILAVIFLFGFPIVISNLIT